MRSRSHQSAYSTGKAAVPGSKPKSSRVALFLMSSRATPMPGPASLGSPAHSPASTVNSQRDVPAQSRLIYPASRWREGPVSEGVAGHARVVEDEAGIAVEAAHGGDDAVVGVRTDDADGEAAQAGGVFGAVPGPDSAAASESVGHRRLAPTTRSCRCPPKGGRFASGRISMVPIASSNVGFSRASISYAMRVSGKRPYVQCCVGPACKFGPDRNRRFDAGGAAQSVTPYGRTESPAAVPPEQARPEDSGWEFHGMAGTSGSVRGAGEPAFLRDQSDNARAPEHDPSSEVR